MISQHHSSPVPGSDDARCADTPEADRDREEARACAQRGFEAIRNGKGQDRAIRERRMQSPADAITWSVPVAVRIGSAPSEFVHGPLEAIRYLEGRWPAVSGPCLDVARRRCVEAMNQLEHAEAARDAFIAAASEADVLA